MNFIRPYLARPYTNYDASMYIISLLPDGLKVQGRELRERIKSNGAFEDNKFVINECVALVGEYQTGNGMMAAYFDSVAYPALASPSLLGLINVIGINFATNRADHSAGGANAMVPLAPDHSLRPGLSRSGARSAMTKGCISVLPGRASWIHTTTAAGLSALRWTPNASASSKSRARGLARSSTSCRATRSN
jgi:hypothetical protein